MQQLAENLWIKKFPLKVAGTDHGRTMTVIRLESGRTVIHSMAPFTPEDIAEIRALGEPGWLVEAMLLHDTYAKEGRDAFPGLPVLGPPGFGGIVGFPVMPLTSPPPEWREELVVFAVAGAPKLEEHAIVHIPSRTLIVADLIFNFRPEETGWNRFFHRHIAGFKRYPGMSRVFRLFIKDKPAFRRSIRQIIAADFERIIVGHGDVIDKDGRTLLLRGLDDAGFPGIA